jgi:hypothetical protein
MAAVHDESRELEVLDGEEVEEVSVVEMGRPVGKDVRIEVYVGADPDMLFLMPWELYWRLGVVQLPFGLYRVTAQAIRRYDVKTKRIW